MSKRSRAIFTLAKKEFMDNVRSKWVLVLTFVFIGLILLISAYGGVQAGREAGIKGYEFTINYGSSIVVIFISIVAIVMGYKTLVSEVESKSVGLLLTSEMDRKDIVIGKFIGLFVVLGVSIIGGLIIGGLVIGISESFENVDKYLYFILISLVFGITYLTISMFLSSVVNKQSRALAGGVFIWIFFTYILDLVLIGILIATGWELSLDPTVSVTYPDWYHQAGILSPNRIYNMLTQRILEMGTLPDVITLPMLIISFILWVFIPLFMSIIIFDMKNM